MAAVKPHRHACSVPGQTTVPAVYLPRDTLVIVNDHISRAKALFISSCITPADICSRIRIFLT